MNVLVVYHSKTGRTMAMAGAICEGAGSVDGITPVLRSVEEVTEQDFVDSAAVIAGSPVYFGTLSAELKGIFDRFIGTRRQMLGKVGAAFTTGNHHTGGKETTLLSILQALLIYGMIVVGDPLQAAVPTDVGGGDPRVKREGLFHPHIGPAKYVGNGGASHSRGRPLPVVHDLHHGCCAAAH